MSLLYNLVGLFSLCSAWLRPSIDAHSKYGQDRHPDPQENTMDKKGLWSFLQQPDSRCDRSGKAGQWCWSVRVNATTVSCLAQLRLLQREGRTTQGSVCAMQLQWALQWVWWRYWSGYELIMYFIQLASRIVSSTLPGLIVNGVKMVTMETQPTGPAVPVHAPPPGKFSLLFVPRYAMWLSLVYAILLWPVWTSAQEWLNACVNRLRVEPDVRGGSVVQRNNQTQASFMGQD